MWQVAAGWLPSEWSIRSPRGPPVFTLPCCTDISGWQSSVPGSVGEVTEPPGVQNERTSLAWVRTALGLVACALLAARLAVVRAEGWAVAAALAAAVLAVGVLGWSHDRYRRAARRLEERRAVDFAVPALVLTIAVVTVGVLGLLLIAL